MGDSRRANATSVLSCGRRDEALLNDGNDAGKGKKSLPCHSLGLSSNVKRRGWLVGRC